MPFTPLGYRLTAVTTLLIVTSCRLPLTDCNAGLLSSTLHTFQEASCDGEDMKMQCPEGMLISIQFAQYGRQVPSSQMCPGGIQGDDPMAGRASRLYALWEDTNCLATTSLQVILDQCQDEQQCHLVASSKTFQQDPCPGTRKYLEVAYKCRPNQFSSETVCEGDQLELRCGKSTRLAIFSALFGRTLTGDSLCPELLRNTSALQSACQSRTAVEEMMKRCHGHKRCVVDAEEFVFGNPCPKGVNKYLNVVYTCVPKRVLKPLRRHNPRKRKKKKPDKGSTTSSNSSHHIPGPVASTPSYKLLPHTTKTSSDSEADFPADFPNVDRGPSLGESRDKSHNSKAGSLDVKQSGKTTPCSNLTSRGAGNHQGPSATGLLTDWLNAFNFISRNREKAVLYLVLGVTFGVICLLFLVIIRLAIVNRRKSKAKLDITEPTHESTPAPVNHIETPTLERTDSVDRIEVVRFNPMRSRDFATCTLRSDIGNRSLTNYYG